MPDALPAIISAQPLSQGLTIALIDAANPHPDVGLRPLVPSLRAEADAERARVKAAMQPADPAAIVRWLAPLATLVANAPTGEDLRSKCQAMAIVLSDLPGSLFTPRTQREAAQTFKFWPSAAEVHDLLAPQAKAMAARIIALDKLLRMPAAPQRQAQVDAAQLAREAEANMAKVEALKAECNERARASRPAIRADMARPLNHDDLRTVYEAMAANGNRAAQIRLDALEGRA